MSDAAIGTKEWHAEWRRRRVAAATQMWDEFEASGDVIPDIDFSVNCPICGEELHGDGDEFYCEICPVTWPRNGYGHEAQRHDLPVTNDTTTEGA